MYTFRQLDLYTYIHWNWSEVELNNLKLSSVEFHSSLTNDESIRHWSLWKLVKFAIRHAWHDKLNVRYFLRIIRRTIHKKSSKSKRMLTYGVYGTASFRKNAPGACITEATESINCPKKHCTHAEKKHHCEISLTLAGCSVHWSGLIPGAKSRRSLWP